MADESVLFDMLDNITRIQGALARISASLDLQDSNFLQLQDLISSHPTFDPVLAPIDFSDEDNIDLGFDITPSVTTAPLISDLVAYGLVSSDDVSHPKITRSSTMRRGLTADGLDRATGTMVIAPTHPDLIDITVSDSTIQSTHHVQVYQSHVIEMLIKMQTPKGVVLVFPCIMVPGIHVQHRGFSSFVWHFVGLGLQIDAHLHGTDSVFDTGQIFVVNPYLPRDVMRLDKRDNWKGRTRSKPTLTTIALLIVIEPATARIGDIQSTLVQLKQLDTTSMCLFVVGIDFVHFFCSFSNFFISLGSNFGVDWLGRTFGFDSGLLSYHAISLETIYLAPSHNSSTHDVMDVINVHGKCLMHLACSWPRFGTCCGAHINTEHEVIEQLTIQVTAKRKDKLVFNLKCQLNLKTSLFGRKLHLASAFHDNGHSFGKDIMNELMVPLYIIDTLEFEYVSEEALKKDTGWICMLLFLGGGTTTSIALNQAIEMLSSAKQSVLMIFFLIGSVVVNERQNCAVRIKQRPIQGSDLCSCIYSFDSSVIGGPITPISHYGCANLMLRRYVLSWFLIFYANSNTTHDAIQVFEHMWVPSLKPHLRARMILLNSLVNERLTATMWDFYKKVVQIWVAPDLHIYSILIHACFTSLDAWKVEDWLSGLEFKGAYPYLFTYTTLILLHCKKGMHYEALSLQDRMNKSVNSYIEAMCLLEEMQAQKALIKRFCQTDRIDHAQILYDLMLLKGIPGNGILFTILAYAYLKAGDTTIDAFNKLGLTGQFNTTTDQGGSFLDPDIIFSAALYGHKPPNIARFLCHSSGCSTIWKGLFNQPHLLLSLHLEDKVNLKGGVML